MTNPTPFANGLKVCACAAYTNVETGEHTGCAQGTKGTFAPGHDAKLKKLLIAAGVQGARVDVAGQEQTVAEILAAYPGLADKVNAGIYNARRNAKPAKPAKVAAPAPAPIEIIEVPIKSGKATKFQAEYQGVIGTRSSKTRVYTHAAVYQIGTAKFIGSWHASAALAAKGTNGLKPIAVVPVTVAK
jgi:hypothetical protein